jgi:replicative DNA helicase
MTTWDKIAAVLRNYNLKQVGREEWRSNRPWSAKSDSMGLAIKVLPDGEYGAWKDHVADEGGSLYELAARLNVELPERAEITPTKRGYTDLADYAQAHGAPVEAFSGWTETTCNGRPALHFMVGDKDRWRFIDGAPGKENFYWKKGSHPALYGWARALDMAKRTGRKPIYVNGAATVRVGQWYGIPAFTVEGGEHAIPDALIDQLAAEWDGEFIFALDSDYTGQKAMYGSVAKLAAKGRKAYNADLALMDRGDLCDFRKLHEENTYAELERRAVVPKAGDEPTPPLSMLAESARVMDQQVTQTHGDPDEAALRQLDQIEQHVERAKDKLRPVRVMDMADLARAALDPAKNAKRWPTLAIPELAALVGPLEPELYVIYGAPNMGKSWMAVSFAGALMKQGTGLMITTETRPDKWFRRIVSYQSRVPLDRVDDGIASEAERKAWNKVVAGMAGYPGAMMDMSSPTGKAIVRAALKVRKEQGLDWIVVDSATRMRGIGSNSYERTSNVAHALQDMARDFNVPVIITSQIGRDVGERPHGQKLPRMEDAYGSGAIEQDAGVVLGLYRHDYYVTRGSEVPDDATFPPNTARVILLKHRNRRVPPTNWANVLMDEGCGFYPYRAQPVNVNTMEGVA